jgi:hypothetical protein
VRAADRKARSHEQNRPSTAARRMKRPQRQFESRVPRCAVQEDDIARGARVRMPRVADRCAIAPR